MNVTMELLGALLERGWSIQGRRYPGNRPDGEPIIEYRDPTGCSGTDHWARRLDEFPKPVAEWIWQNVPLVPAKTG